MNAEIIIQKFNILPENLQNQVSDYIEFLANKYLDNSKTGNDVNELPLETRQILNDCLNDYLKNPGKVKTWEQVENEIVQEHGYEL